ncbi:hypothetical protein D3C72_1875440 [compost metagenome]
MPQLDAGKQGIAQGQQGRPQTIAAQAAVIPEQAALHQRVGQPRDGGLGQARAIGQFPVAERGLAVPEGLQHRQAMRQRGGEGGVGVAVAKRSGHGLGPERASPCKARPGASMIGETLIR